ncbi:MAG: gliding motility-associated ABC transporter permease subunit GldF [Bacteroidetes bacterium]|nr:gliding motility-associated ABC transporter permease subunit GldF [Bacteroidota bacterium]
MLALLKKEITSFLSSLIGYIVICVFLLSLGLFLWVFPGEFNVMDMKFAHLEGLFIIAPWLFMFLIPAITMRMFADEKKTGTFELLMTQPLTDFQVILAKYLAALLLVIFSLLPTLVYFYSVVQLGNPKGNIDYGGTWGSYIGLLFLSSGFVSIGIFSSAITENQIISFIVGMFLCFFVYTGFDFVSSMEFFGKVDDIILLLGIQEHYASMSRGVIDTRDAIYFISIIAIFILLTKTVLGSRKW